MNCRNVPISIFPQEGLVDDYLVLPEIHLYLECFNKVFKECIRAWPDVIEWPEQLNTETPDYDNGNFEENQVYNNIVYNYLENLMF